MGQGYSCLGSSKILNFVYLVKALYSSSLPANEQPKAKRPTSHAGVNWKPKYGQIIGMSKIHLFSGENTFYYGRYVYRVLVKHNRECAGGKRLF